MKRHTAQSGFSLIEMLVYITILSIIFLVVVTTILSFTTNYRSLAIHRVIEHSALSSFERMTRDVRGATSVDVGNSTLNTNPGTLTIVATHGAVSTTTKFYIDSGILKINVNGSYVGPLSTSNVLVTYLSFSFLEGSTTNAVKMNMTIEGASGVVTKSKNYETTIVMKGS